MILRILIYLQGSSEKRLTGKKHQPGRVSCSQQLGCRSIFLHFLWDVSLTTPVHILRENYSDPLCAMPHKQPTNPSFLSNVTDGFWRNKQMPLHPHPYPLTLPLSPTALFVSTANFSPFCPFLWPSVVVGRPNMVGIHTRCWSRKADDIGNDIKGHIGLLH